LNAASPAAEAVAPAGLPGRKRTGTIIGVVAALLGIAYLLLGESPIRHGPGMAAPDAPLQGSEFDRGTFTFKGEYIIEPLATFELTARALSTERYYLGTESDLAPVDVAFGWGGMSADNVLDELSISQGGRFYFWEYSDTPPLPRSQIESSSANMHLIPATDAIEARIKDTRIGHLVRLKGFLVKVIGPGGWNWRSSLTRSDTGGGACEVVFVEEYEFVKKGNY